MSYRVRQPVLVGSFEVIKGTSTLEDVAHWPSVPLGRPSGRLWRQASRVANLYAPRGFVGHSLGAEWALKLSRRYGGSYRGYGRPGFGPSVSGDVMNLGDPVSAFLVGRKALSVGHSLASYG